MESHWWQMPGPAGFIEQIIQSLRDGKSVLIQLPKHAPDGLRQAVRAAWSQDATWSTVRVSELNGLLPAQALAQRFASDLPITALRNAQMLCQSDAFAGRVLWIEDLPAAGWPTWKTFLQEYQHASHAVSLLRRTLFCVALVGELALDPPPQDICLAHHCWRGVVERLDMMLFTANLLRHSRQPPILKEIAISAIAHLAGTDPEVAERLAHESFEQILAPFPVLQKLGRERGWPLAPQPIQWHAWQNGSIDSQAGRNLMHSAAMASDGHTEELTQRVWSAQVGIVFPFLEKCRQQFIRQFWELLTVPFETSYEIITDKRDLELAHLEVQFLRRGAGFPSKMLKRLQLLKRIRNMLAHSEPIEPSLLLGEEFYLTD